MRAAFSEAENEVDMAINQTVAALFNPNTSAPKNYGDLFKIVRFPTGKNYIVDYKGKNNFDNTQVRLVSLLEHQRFMSVH